MKGRSFGHHPLVRNHFLSPMSRYICPIGYFEARSSVDLTKRIATKTTIPNDVVASASSTKDEVH